MVRSIFALTELNRRLLIYGLLVLCSVNGSLRLPFGGHQYLVSKFQKSWRFDLKSSSQGGQCTHSALVIWLTIVQLRRVSARSSCRASEVRSFSSAVITGASQGAGHTYWGTNFLFHPMDLDTGSSRESIAGSNFSSLTSNMTPLLHYWDHKLDDNKEITNKLNFIIQWTVLAQQRD